jgi:exopolysaccharide biosynthesis polyprenyl glycosylphosphotransferase
LFDAVVIGLSFGIPYFLYYHPFTLDAAAWRGVPFPFLREHLSIFFLWGGLVVAMLRSRNLYLTARELSILREIYLTLTSVAVVSIIIAAVIFFAQMKFFSRAVFTASLASLSAGLTLWRVIKRLALRYLVKRGFHNFNVLIVGTNKVARLLVEEIRRHPYLGLNIVGAVDDVKGRSDWDVPLLGGLDDFADVCRKHFIDEVYITLPSDQNGTGKIMRLARTMPIAVRIVPADFEAAHRLIELSYLGFVPLLTYEERDLRSTELVIKRVFDMIVAFLLLLVLAPVFLVIGVLIKLDSPGPVFYAQKRMGKQGKNFNIYKFRSMRDGAEALKSQLLEKNEMKGGIIFKLKKDPRITRMGRLLRRHSLDELPQLFNVLRGDMSLVGPRPFPVEESRRFEVCHMPRWRIKPGITGLAQVRGRSDLSLSHWVRWDLWYIKNWSFWLDLRILSQTLPTVLKGKGAY